MNTLIIFTMIALVIGLAIKPTNIYKKVPLNMVTGSIFSIVFLLVFGFIDLDTIKEGIFGSGNLRPWEIIVIFFTVAYVSVSTDITGIFDYIAFKIIQSANGSGLKLFFLFYLFACTLTIFTSNDIVILTLTPIIFYLGKHAHINIIPLLFAEFFGANTLSMLFYIGNPTNIIVGNSLGLGFFEYTEIMWLPTLVAAILEIVLLYLFFRKDITGKFKVKDTSNYKVLNWYDALISIGLMVLLFVTLMLSSIWNIPIWIITTIFAIIFIIEDSIFWIYYSILKRKNVHQIPSKVNRSLLAFKKVPWRILPFIGAFFILVHSLNVNGFLDHAASIVSGTIDSLGSSIATIGTLSFLGANILNNQPMTILFTNMLLSDSYQVPEVAFTGSIYAILIASNLGANLTLVGSLAGLMWHGILKDKGVEVSYIYFLKKGLLITPIVFICTLFTLYLVLI